ncbi:hypothetical protein [Thermus tengchongensis]|uniref:hypothetical protein n=1 Tax=Thermus tengchongensis TaxID=1214928 RepID=UPI001F269CE2|nr:hypothetical protein [Thermus tengchongensis]
MWRQSLILASLILLAACGVQPVPPVSGDLDVGGTVLPVPLPAAEVRSGGRVVPAVKTFRIRLPNSGAVQVSAVSAQLQLRGNLRLVLLNDQGVVQAVSVARDRFGVVAEIYAYPLGLTPQVFADIGIRLNFRGTTGQVFYLRVENLATEQDTASLKAVWFTPDPNGDPSRPLQPLSLGSTIGAIEFVGEADMYQLNPGSGPYLCFEPGVLDLVAKVSASTTPGNPVRLDRVMRVVNLGDLGFTPSIVVVQERNQSMAGFNDPESRFSGRYTLTLSASPCP